MRKAKKEESGGMNGGREKECVSKKGRAQEEKQGVRKE